MTSILWLSLAFFLAFTGCTMLSLSQKRNWLAVVRSGQAPASTRRLRWSGWMSLVGALYCCVERDGGSFAALLWPLFVGLATGLVAMLLSYRPNWLKLATKLFS